MTLDLEKIEKVVLLDHEGNLVEGSHTLDVGERLRGLFKKKKRSTNV